MPRLRYSITLDDRDKARDLASIGASHEDIAAQLRLGVHQLQRLFKRELERGASEGKTQILRTLHNVAVSGENASLLSFCIKARCGWRDTGTPAGPAPGINRVLVIKHKENARERLVA